LRQNHTKILVINKYIIAARR